MKTINFMYFAHNFSQVQMEQIFNVLPMPNHFRNKFETATGNNGTTKFFNWFMNLSTDNQLILVEWIDNNYNGISF